MARLSTRALVILLLVLGIGLGALTAAGVYATARAAAIAQAQAAVAPVVVAVHPIAAHSQIHDGDVKVQQERVSDVPGQAATRTADVVGKVALADLYTGAPILQPQVATVDSARSLGYTLPQGMEAMALPTPDLVSGAAAIQPGDRIDIILTVPAKSSQDKAKETQFALQNIQVIGVGQVLPPPDPSGKAGAPQGSLTILVSPQQALLLTYAKESAAEGVSINLVLRRPDDKTTYDTAPVTLDQLQHYLESAH